MELKSRFPFPLHLFLIVCLLAATESKRESPSCGLSCNHGVCEENRCVCYDCWTGPACDLFQNRFAPIFEDDNATVMIGDWSPSVAIHRVTAYDDDQLMTCSGRLPCDCAQIIYGLSDDEQQSFSIDQSSGEIFTSGPLPEGGSCNLTVSARNPFDTNKRQSTEISFYRAGSSAERRGKRSTEGSENNYQTSFQLSLVKGETKSMEIGQQLDYALQVTLPQTTAMDLTIEIFSRDYVDTKFSPSLTLFDLQVNAPQWIVKPEVRNIFSDVINNVCERMVIDFGVIDNPRVNSTILLSFSVAVVRNLAASTGKAHYITAGAEYDNKTFVWVGHSQVFLAKSQPTTPAKLEVEVKGSSSAAIDRAVVFTFDLFLAIRSENATVEATTTGGDELSLGHIGVTEFGKHFSPVPQDPDHYRMTRFESDNKEVMSRAHLDLGLLTNVGPPKQTAKRPENRIQLTVAIFVTPEARVASHEFVAVAIRVAGVKLWSNTLELTIAPRENHQVVASVSTRVEVDRSVASTGDLVTYTLRTQLRPNSFADFRVEVADDGGQFQPCSGQVVKQECGFNVPFANSSLVAPVRKANRLLFEFGRIQVTNQRSPSKAEDDTVEIDMVFRAPDVDNGTRLDTTFFVSTALDEATPIETPSVFATQKDEQVPAVKVQNAGRWSELYRGGAVVVNVTAALKPGASYTDVTLEIAGMNSTRLPDLRICRVELVWVGRSLPCLRLDLPSINARAVKIDGRYGQVSLGTVSSVQATLADHQESQVDLQVTAEIGQDSSIPKKSEPYSLSLGMSISRSAVWAADLTYTLVDSSPPPLKHENVPVVEVFLRSSGPFQAGQAVEVTVALQTAPLTVGQYKISLTSEREDLDVCRLRATSAGHSLPCFDLDTPASYPRRGPRHGSRQALMIFKALTNVGVVPKSSNPRSANTNHVFLSGVLLTSPRVQGSFNGSVSWIVEYGGGKKVSGVIQVPVSPFVQTTPTLSFTSQGLKTGAIFALTSSIGPSAPIPLTLEIDLQPYFLGPLSLTITGESAVPYQICNAVLLFKGRNYPCFKHDQIQVLQTTSKFVNDSVTFDLGIVSNTYNHPEVRENRIKVGLTIKLTGETPAVGSELQLRAVASVAGHRVNLGQVNMTTVEEQDDVLNAEQQSGQVVAALNKSVSLRVRERRWIPFRVTIPPHSLTRVRATALADSRDQRALFTLHGLRLAATGQNIPCSDIQSRGALEVKNSSAGVSTVQVTKMTTDLGFFTNTGDTHGLNISRAGDDDVLLEVLVEMADYANASADLTLKVQMLNADIEARQSLQTQRDGSDLPDVKVAMTVDDSHAYKDGEEIELTAVVHLSEQSRAEPNDVLLRLYLPPFVAFESFSSSGVSPGQEPTLKSDPSASTLDFHMPYLLFPDRVEMRIFLRARPVSVQGFGSETNLATTLFRLLCRRGSTRGSCGRMGQVLYRVVREDCDEPLGMADGRIEDCQLTADSAASSERAPRNARLGSPRGWSPALWSELHERYLQVDLLHHTRLSAITLEAPPGGDRRVAKFRLLESNDGVNWLHASPVTSVHYKGQTGLVHLPRPLETRFIRFVVVEAEMGDNSSYVGVKFELHGCYLRRNQSASCGDDDTWYSDSEEDGGRHFSVDVSRNILYYCDRRPFYSREGQCYSSSDSGTTWKALPWNIGRILGYDPGMSSVLAADLRNRAFLATSDGRRWVAVSSEKVNSTVDMDVFDRSRSVPALDVREIGEAQITHGKWKASFTGLHFGNKNSAKAIWTSCCSVA